MSAMKQVNSEISSKETEMMVLGCMLWSVQSLKIASELLSDTDFYYSGHKAIFQVLKKAYTEGKPVDIHLICEELRKENQLKYVGDILYITSLTKFVKNPTDVKTYCENLKQHTVIRQLIHLRDLLAKDLEIGANGNKILCKLKDNLHKIENKIKISSHLSYLLENHSEKKLVQELSETYPGVFTGFVIGEEDVKIPGGAISAVVMPTGHGKTTTLINYSLGVLNHHLDKSVYFFTYEDSEASIQTLFMNTYINKEISKDNRESIRNYFLGRNKSLSELDDFVVGKKDFFENLIDNGRLKVIYSEMSVEELIDAIHFIKKYTNVGLVSVDYLQLLRLSNGTQDLKMICHMLKNCAIETGLPILLGAEFNQTVISEADLSPVEASDIEQIAHLMIGGWNRNFVGFNRNGNIGRDGKPVAKESTIYFEIMKGRGVKPGTCSIQNFNGNLGKIIN